LPSKTLRPAAAIASAAAASYRRRLKIKITHQNPRIAAAIACKLSPPPQGQDHTPKPKTSRRHSLPLLHPIAAASRHVYNLDQNQNPLGRRFSSPHIKTLARHVVIINLLHHGSRCCTWISTFATTHA
jgi:hypothetical protein